MFKSALILVVTVLLTTTAVTGQTCDVENAVYNPTSKSCKCLPDYEGDGSLCCVPKQQHDVCYFSGDPYLHSNKGVSVPVNIPCAICLNVMQGSTSTNKECKFEVLGSSTIMSSGAMYNSVVKIGVSVNKRSPRYFTIFNGQVKDSSTNANITLTADMKGSVDHEGAVIDFMYNKQTGFWTLNGCGNKITFRLTEDMDKGKPGVCMLAGKDTSKVPITMGNLCNLESTFNQDSNVTLAYGVAKSALVMRTKFDSEQLMSHPDYDAVCKNTIDKQLEFVEYCASPDGRDPLEVCGPLLYNSVLRSCLTSGGTNGADLANLFGNCLAALCGFSQEACTAYKSDTALQACAPSMTTCDEWLK